MNTNIELMMPELPPMKAHLESGDGWMAVANGYTADQMREYASTVLAIASQQGRHSLPSKLWLCKNFAGGQPEYWAFDNAYPVNIDNGDPQTLGEPCGYVVFKPSRAGRTDVSEEQVLQAIKRATPAPANTLNTDRTQSAN